MEFGASALSWYADIFFRRDPVDHVDRTQNQPSVVNTQIDARFKTAVGAFNLDVAFTCPNRGITGLFGPSGSGKTTVLRCLAGLVHADEGYLNVGGSVWQNANYYLPPHARPVGYVFQEARLFPHLSVLKNLHYGMRRMQARSGDTIIDPDTVISLLGIAPLLDRTPNTLSGGERQRIAIGRALLAQPKVLLMDEPLSALDRDSKREILPYLEDLNKTLLIPIIYVSHDISEIERLADYLVLMTKQGTVLASGPLQTLLTDTRLPLARAADAASVIDLIVTAYDTNYDVSECAIGDHPFFVPGNLGVKHTSRRIRIQASDVSLAKDKPNDTSILNVLPARICAVEATHANQMLVVLSLDSGAPGAGLPAQLLSSVTRKSWDTLSLSVGDNVFAQVKSTALVDDV